MVANWYNIYPVWIVPVPPDETIPIVLPGVPAVSISLPPRIVTPADEVKVPVTALPEQEHVIAIAAPTGKFTAEFAGIVKIVALAVILAWSTFFPLSVKTKV